MTNKYRNTLAMHIRNMAEPDAIPTATRSIGTWMAAKRRANAERNAIVANVRGETE